MHILDTLEPQRDITETLSLGHALTSHVLKPVNVLAKTTETEKHTHRDTSAREIFALRWVVCRRCLPPYVLKWCGTGFAQSDTLLGTCANSTAHLSSVTRCCLIAIDPSPSPDTHTHTHTSFTGSDTGWQLKKSNRPSELYRQEGGTPVCQMSDVGLNERLDLSWTFPAEWASSPKRRR